MRSVTSLLKASSSSRLAAQLRILDVNTGEVVAMASLPDFDPNTPPDPRDLEYINRLSVGVYEMGSTFKAISVAMALDWGKVVPFADRRPRELTLWPFHNSRFPCDAPDVERARSFHVFIQHRRCPHGLDGRRRGA